MNEEKTDFILKTIIIGDLSVGKSSILRKLTQTTMHYNETPTIGVDFFTINTKISTANNNYDVKMHFWDTAGHEKYQRLVKSYYNNNAICYVVFDVTNKKSFNSVDMWVKSFTDNTSNPNAIIVIVANKIDCANRQVESEEGLKYAKSIGAFYVEVSSKKLIGLEKLIEEPVQQLLSLYENKKIKPSDQNGCRNLQQTSKINFNINNKNCCVIS
jgi:small GTP-binding protein